MWNNPQTSLATSRCGFVNRGARRRSMQSCQQRQIVVSSSEESIWKPRVYRFKYNEVEGSSKRPYLAVLSELFLFWMYFEWWVDKLVR